ncbi:J domain-containing protein [Dokdonella ginsengisoli]|uniref:J domain-containing protein n=1 Tax=Dokdonella ginsengisoli TaxID=363846 RepID=A0ABV9QRR4_9GAMM
MSSPTDFVAFYQQLGLGPDCSLTQLKNAYRRRVAELHPDRHPQRGADPGAAAQLQELTAAYHAALGFERRHGRLPGARLPADPGGGTAHSPRRPPDPSRRTGLRRVAVAALALAALVWLAWDGSGHDEPVAIAPPASAPVEERRFVPLPPPVEPGQTLPEQRIELGMEAAAVRVIEGRPVMETPERWDYGPSWIEFERGRVSDWYSSRLRPLKVAAARPAH